MSRTRYQIAVYNVRGLDPAIHWSLTLGEAKAIATKIKRYKNCLADSPGVYCACDKCLQYCGANNIQITHYPLDSQEFMKSPNRLTWSKKVDNKWTTWTSLKIVN